MTIERARSAEDYGRALGRLLPPGVALARRAGSAVMRLLEGVGVELARLDVRARQLINEMTPSLTDELIEEWEAHVGLPDECTGDDGASVETRRSRVVAKLRQERRMSEDYYIGLAAGYGYTVTIDHFQPADCNSDCNAALNTVAAGWPFAWLITVDGEDVFTSYANCNGDCNDALRLWDDAVLECVIERQRPAHTVPIFEYTGGS